MADKASPEGSPKREDVAFLSFICEIARIEECHKIAFRVIFRVGRGYRGGKSGDVGGIKSHKSA